MSGGDTTPAGANSAAIDAAVVERVAADHGVAADELAALITVVGADLTDSHHECELKYDHATVDDTRVYAVTDEKWREIIERNNAADLEDALRAAHHEQAVELLADPPATPLVVGIDTAEEPDAIPQQYD